MLTSVVLFYHILLFMIFQFDKIMETKCKSDSETKNSCKVKTLHGKIKIPDGLHGGPNNNNWPYNLLIFYFKV
jgi:hypothetical protein